MRNAPHPAPRGADGAAHCCVSAHSDLVSALVMVATAGWNAANGRHNDGAVATGANTDYLAHILQLAEQHLVAVVQRPDFVQRAQRPDTLAQLAAALEVRWRAASPVGVADVGLMRRRGQQRRSSRHMQMLRGIVLATDSTNVERVFAVCERHFGTLVALVRLYHTHPEEANLVLNLFGAIVGHAVTSRPPRVVMGRPVRS